MYNLDKYNFSTKEGFNSTLLKLRYSHLSRYFKGDSCLELGPADGEGTKILLKYFKKVVAVDGSKKLINKAKKEIKSKKVVLINSYFENLDLEEKFDTIMMAHVLEHVKNPVLVIKIATKFLKKDGIIIVDVPNALSIHRQVGVLMGMLKSEYELNKQDLSIGHKRVYNMQKLVKDITLGGLRVKNKGGIFLKPFSNAQMEKILSKKRIEAFSLMGIKFPEIAAEIYVVCSLK